MTHVDYSDHLALVAEVFVDGRETVIAEARYVRGPDKTSAEFAVSVADPWQGKGLARLLLGKIACRAVAAGVTRIVGETLASNARMLALARKAGFVSRPSPDVAGLMLLEKAASDRDAATAQRRRRSPRPRCRSNGSLLAGPAIAPRTERTREPRSSPALNKPSAAASSAKKTSTGANAHIASAETMMVVPISQARSSVMIRAAPSDSRASPRPGR